MGGGLLREVVTRGGSTVFIYICPFQARKRQARGGHVAQNTHKRITASRLLVLLLKTQSSKIR